MLNETQPKVFICYACEDRDLLENFVRKFKAFNHDLNVTFFDKVQTYFSNDKTMHDRLIRFAKKCYIALILAEVLTISY